MITTRGTTRTTSGSSKARSEHGLTYRSKPSRKPR
uniref:Uncharacterized protein n=1 Tax=Arundo donax TaxID=35708 RepID=A0A0A9ES62_ARUDO